MILALLTLLLASMCAVPAVRLMGPRAGWVLPLPLVGVALFFAARLPDLLAGDEIRLALPWVASLGIDFALRLDGLAWLFAMLVLVIGAIVMVYAAGYFRQDQGQLGRFAALMLLFATSMLGLVLADDIFVLFVAWELTSLCSFLLIGLQNEKEDARSGALRALLVTGGGGIALLLGLMLLADAAGTSSLSELLQRGDLIATSPLYMPSLVLIVVGAFSKSAQVPFHYWLPGAMAAPAPVSAYLHSATLVKAGVFLLARLHPALSSRIEWHLILGHIGALTMLVGAAMAFGQRDLKRMLAFSTVAGLGTVVMLLGIGTTAALQAALLFVVVHALYKASLFMVVGTLEKATGLRDVDRLQGLARALPLLFIAALVAALSMMGLPPLLGAIAKELVYEAKLGAPEAPVLLTIAGTAAGVFTVACALLVGVRPFLGRGQPPEVARSKITGWLLLPPALLAFLGIWLGFEHDRLLAPVLDAAREATGAAPDTQELLADASPATVTWLSKGALVAGVVLYLIRNRLRSWRERLGRLASLGPARLHDALYAAVTRSASTVATLSGRRVAGSTLVLVAIGIVTAGAGAVAAAGVPSWPGDGLPALHEAMFFALVLSGTVVMLRTPSPRAAVAALGAVGIGMGLIFLSLGGPDLAMTQVAVDALAVLLALLVLRRVGRLTMPRVGFRTGALALGVGVVFMLLTWSAAPDGALRPVSELIGELSVPVGKGRNVVNVILVDVRALDTLSEIVVLAVAALGVIALLRRRNKEVSA